MVAGIRFLGRQDVEILAYSFHPLLPTFRMPVRPLDRLTTKDERFSLRGCSIRGWSGMTCCGIYELGIRILVMCLFATATAAIAGNQDTRQKPSPILTALTSCKSAWKYSEPITIIAAVYFPSDQYGTILRLYDGNRFLLKTGICFNLGRYRFKNADGTSLSQNSGSLQTYIFTIPANRLELGKHIFTLKGTHMEQPLTMLVE